VCHKGEWFSPDHQGYLRSTTGAAHRAGGARVLQRVIWEEANGPVPPGCLIIFADGDKRNCALENLACKTRSEWRRDPRSHSANGWTVFRREEERLWREIEAAEAAESSLEALPRLTAALDALEAHRQKRPKLSAAHLAKITQAGKACWAAYTAEERAERIRKMRARRWPK
jgi:hypothetical protein